jgi:hypothetical protein
MTTISRILALLMFGFAMPFAVGQDGNGPTTEEIVVPADGVTDFTVTARSRLFRIPVSTIAGGAIGKPVVTGSAKHIRTEEITTVDESGEPMIGGLNQHLVFRGTGAGKVRIVVKIKSPVSPDPDEKTFNVTIK